MKLMVRSALPALLLVVVAACTPDDVTFEPPPYQVEPPPPPPEYQIAHTFRYIPHDDTQEVTSIEVRGGFNGWGGGEPFFMTEQANGVWSVTVPFDADSTYEYKYVFNGPNGWAGNMCAEDVWGNPPGGPVDPDNDNCADGGNAILVVDPDGPPAHTFRYIPHETTEEITWLVVRGQFNGWGDGDIIRMIEHEGIWRVTVGLEPGTYEYKYVFNDTNGWAGNMCAEDRWGNPPGGPVDPDNDNCADGGNAILTH
jgi:hypothetical protein